MLRRTGISLALLLVLVTVLALVGCSSSKAPKTTNVSATDVINDAMTAQAGVTSVSTNVNIAVSWQGSDNGSPVTGSISSIGNIDLNPSQKKMYTHTGLTLMVIPLSLDAYIVDNCSYIQLTVTGQPKGWAKQTVDSGFWESLSFTKYQTDLSRFIGTMNKQYVGEETVNGEDCYKLTLTPDMAQLQAMLDQSAGEQTMDLDELITSMSSTVWVSEQTSRFMKVQFSSQMSIPSEMIASAGVSSFIQVDGDLTVTLDVTMAFSNFNQVPAINLTTEAQGATEQAIDVYFGSALASLMALA